MRPALLLWILFCIGALTMNSQVKLWEGTMPLTASDEGPPDENPNFDTFAEVEDYYTMRQNIRATETDPANMPEPLVRALVEALREIGRNDEANAVLAHRFLQRKEGEAPLQPQK
jgi:hypothetical protein